MCPMQGFHYCQLLIIVSKVYLYELQSHLAVGEFAGSFEGVGWERAISHNTTVQFSWFCVFPS